MSSSIIQLARAGIHDERERGRQLAEFVANARQIAFPDEVIHQAKRALVDYLACSIGAAKADGVAPVRHLVKAQAAAGRARILGGGTTSAALAAFANGTMTHAVDYDDTHPGGAGHVSGPCWSAALAAAQAEETNEKDTLAAYVCGYEVMGKLGGGGERGVGRTLQRLGFHPTGVIGTLAASAVASSLSKLNEAQVINALAVAATMTGGLQRSAGTQAKPLHAGKSAMDGIFAAQLAAEGLVGREDLFEVEKGWLAAYIQTDNAVIPELDFGKTWEILKNGFKLYAACRAVHPSIESAAKGRELVAERKIVKVRAKVHPTAMVAAGNRNPNTPLEAKFSTFYCIALALSGYALTEADFENPALTEDPQARQLLPLVECTVIDDQSPHASYMEIELESGELLHIETAVVKGHRDNPASDADLKLKFDQLVEPVLGAEAARGIYDAATRFETKGASNEIWRLTAGSL